MVDKTKVQALVRRFVEGTDDINNKTDWFMFNSELDSLVTNARINEIHLADIGLSTKYGEDWLAYRDDRMKELVPPDPKEDWRPWNDEDFPYPHLDPPEM